MERLTTSIHEDARYVTRSGQKRQSDRDHGKKRGHRGLDVAPDERRDLPNDEAQQRRWTDDVANQLTNIFCESPCFVNTSNSMDSGNPPDNHRMAAPAGSVPDSDDMAISGSSLHGPPSPPVRFPSMHLGADEWHSEDEAESAFFHSTLDGRPIIGTRLGARLRTDESIYRTPRSTGNLSAALSKVPLLGRPPMISSANMSLASTNATAASSKFGIYRSPAWSDDDTDGAVSIAGDEEDWLDAEPAAERGNATTVIDVTHMEGDFQNFSLSGGHAAYNGGRR